MRRVVGAALGVAVAVLGAVILGEYDFAGANALWIGAVFGLVVGETVGSVARVADGALAAAAALAAEGGLLWGAWIAFGHRLDWLPVTSWIGIATGAAVAAVWVRAGGRRARRSPGFPAPAPDEASSSSR